MRLPFASHGLGISSSSGTPVTPDRASSAGSDFSSHLRPQTARAPSSTTSTGDVKGILSMDQVRQGTVKFIYTMGQSKTVNISGCFNAESIIRTALKKFAIKDSPNNWCIHVSDNAFATSTRIVSDNELVTICHSPSRAERRRLMLCLNDMPPTQKQFAKSQSVLLESVDTNTNSSSSSGNYSANQPTISQLSGDYFSSDPKKMAPLPRSIFPTILDDFRDSVIDLLRSSFLPTWQNIFLRQAPRCWSRRSETRFGFPTECPA